MTTIENRASTRELNFETSDPVPLTIFGTGGDRSAKARAEEWVDQFRDLMEKGRGVEIIHAEIMRAITSARIAIRAPREKDETKWQYVWIDDYATRLTAIRLAMAYLAGLPPSQTDIRVAMPELTGARLRPENVLADLEAIGVSLHEVAEDLRAQIPETRDRGAPVDAEISETSSPTHQ